MSSSGIKEIISAKDCIKFKEEEVLNYFDYFSTYAAAESLNAKKKGFRAELRGVGDLPFYLYRCCMIFG
ncbi:MAG: transposase [Bacteroides sp.]